MFRTVFAPGLPVAEVFVRHEEMIAELEATYNTEALTLEPEQFTEVLTYENRVYSQWLYETGKHDAPPPPPELPAPIRSSFSSSSIESLRELATHSEPTAAV